MRSLYDNYLKRFGLRCLAAGVSSGVVFVLADGEFTESDLTRKPLFAAATGALYALLGFLGPQEPKVGVKPDVPDA